MVSNAVETAKGIGMSNNTVAVRHPRRDVTEDHRHTFNRRSIDISVMISNVMALKYRRPTLPIVVIICTSTDQVITAIGLVKCHRTRTARKGWVMSPVHISVTAKPHRRIWNAVL